MSELSKEAIASRDAESSQLSLRRAAQLAIFTNDGKPFLIGPGGKSITCMKCGRESFHPEDVRTRYCGHCNVFHPPV